MTYARTMGNPSETVTIVMTVSIAVVDLIDRQSESTPELIEDVLDGSIRRRPTPPCRQSPRRRPRRTNFPRRGVACDRTVGR